MNRFNIVCSSRRSCSSWNPPPYWSPDGCTASYDLVRARRRLRCEECASGGQTKATGVQQGWVGSSPARNSPRHHGIRPQEPTPRGASENSRRTGRFSARLTEALREALLCGSYNPTASSQSCCSDRPTEPPTELLAVTRARRCNGCSDSPLHMRLKWSRSPISPAPWPAGGMQLMRWRQGAPHEAIFERKMA